MSIEIKWQELLPDSQEWDHRHVLYAYLNPHTAEIIYLGMAWHRTVRQRFQDGDKNALRDFFLNELGLEGVKIIVGSIWLEGRLTRQLLSDIESLLIKRLRPIFFYQELFRGFTKRS